MMETQDNCCTIAPYFKIHEGKLARTEAKILYYGFSFDGDQMHCREGYEDAEGVLAHLENVGALLKEALTIADLTRLEIHGPAQEIAKLRGPLADLKPQLFTLEYGFRRT
jgi:hypothetical protein